MYYLYWQYKRGTPIMDTNKIYESYIADDLETAKECYRAFMLHSDVRNVQLWLIYNDAPAIQVI